MHPCRHNSKTENHIQYFLPTAFADRFYYTQPAGKIQRANGSASIQSAQNPGIKCSTPPKSSRFAFFCKFMIDFSLFAAV